MRFEAKRVLRAFLCCVFDARLAVRDVWSDGQSKGGEAEETQERRAGRDSPRAREASLQPVSYIRISRMLNRLVSSQSLTE